MTKLTFIRFIALGVFIASLSGIIMPQVINADAEVNLVKASQKGQLKFCGLDKSSFTVIKTVKMMATAYSSSVDETDDNPLITASGQTVADGIIANNMLPFGTKVRIPQLYGNKVFTVQDRMNSRKGNYQIDIWKASKQEARDFGAKVIEIQILES